MRVEAGTGQGRGEAGTLGGDARQTCRAPYWVEVADNGGRVTGRSRVERKG